MEQSIADFRRLSSTPHESWTVQDLATSEKVQLTLIREGHPLLDVARLRTRHRLAAGRLLLSEHSGRGAVLAAERLLGGVTC